MRMPPNLDHAGSSHVVDVGGSPAPHHTPPHPPPNSQVAGTLMGCPKLQRWKSCSPVARPSKPRYKYEGAVCYAEG